MGSEGTQTLPEVGSNTALLLLLPYKSAVPSESAAGIKLPLCKQLLHMASQFFKKTGLKSSHPLAEPQLFAMQGKWSQLAQLSSRSNTLLQKHKLQVPS